MQGPESPVVGGSPALATVSSPAGSSWPLRVGSQTVSSSLMSQICVEKGRRSAECSAVTKQKGRWLPLAGDTLCASTSLSLRLTLPLSNETTSWRREGSCPRDLW